MPVGGGLFAFRWNAVGPRAPCLEPECVGVAAGFAHCAIDHLSTVGKLLVQGTL